MTVFIPSPLRSYTRQRPSVEASGSTLSAVLDDLERRFPGIRFRMIDEQERIRQHIKFFVESEQTHDLETSVSGAHEIHIICALSGGSDATRGTVFASMQSKG